MMNHVTPGQVYPLIDRFSRDMESLRQNKAFDQHILGVLSVQNILHTPGCTGMFLDYPTEAEPDGIIATDNRGNDNPWERESSGLQLGFRVYSHLPASGCEEPTLLDAAIYKYTSQVISYTNAPLRLQCSYTTSEYKVAQTGPTTPVRFTEQRRITHRTLQKVIDAWETEPNPEKRATQTSSIEPDFNILTDTDILKAQEFITQVSVLILGTAQLIKARDKL